ncbi:MAG TPA: DUF4118 domain-containing protein [Candidatus Mediterraneibacter norfolkensis]|nr:DUF4118 domain-containing protein [Candidatus Mediterraneibacter norfolkensis]
MNKHIFCDVAITAVLLLGATALSFCFFHFGNKNLANITVIYILALILIALKTSGYFYGIGASLFCVAAVNYFFSYPYNVIDFSPAGYPVTFIGMLAISIIAGTTTTTLKRQKQAIAEREKALFEAEQEKLRANLLRAVSHDLRTPLTTIIGSSSSYLENYPDLTEEERTELIANIKEDSEWLLNMVENLLTVTRIREDSDDKVKKSSEVVEEVVSEAILRLQKRIPQVRIRVTMPNDFLMLPMDPTLIEQVLINLIENASVHSGCGEPVDLIIKETKDLVSFVVRDYGNGVDPQLLPHIFEGKQHTAVTADGHRGIGIGLSICQTIIQAHGGEISAANHAGGAEFIFTLPKEKENENYV